MDRQEQIEIVNSWMKDISAAIELELRLDSEGACSFQIGDEIIAIEVSEHYPMVHLYSILCPLPVDNPELTTSLLTRALELNGFQILTRGGAIAAPTGGGMLIYCYSLPIEGTDSEKFSYILDMFFETVPEIKKLLTNSDALDVDEKKDVKTSFIKI